MSTERMTLTPRKKFVLQPHANTRANPSEKTKRFVLPTTLNKKISSVATSRNHPPSDLDRCIDVQSLSKPSPLEQTIEKTRECVICCLDQSLDQFTERYADACQHCLRTICDICVYNYLTSLLDDLTDRQNLLCPEPNCTALISFPTLRRLCTLANNARLFERYDRQLTHQHLEQNKEFIWCAYHDCGSGQLHDMTARANPMVTCTQCRRRTCLFHRSKWHVGMTCEEYDRSKRSSTDGRTQLWLSRYCKSCPQCQSFIQKVSGCDHMTCKRCRHQFCWQCLADYRDIHRYGTRRHLVHCSHYPRYPHPSSRRSSPCNIL